MNILIFHMRFYPDLTGTAPLVTQLAVDLTKAGNSVDVVTSLPHYGRRNIHPSFRKHRGVFFVSSYLGVQVWRTPVYVPPSPNLGHRAINYLSYSFFSILAGLKTRKADIILVVNPPITTIFSAWVANLKHRSPIVFVLQDIWPDVLIQVGQLRNRILIRISKWMEYLQYRIASIIVVLSKPMKRNLQGKGVPQEKITIIENWADVEKIRPLPKNGEFRKKHGLHDRFVVMFAGNHGYNAALETVVKAAFLLMDNSEIIFLFIGEGNVKQSLQNQVAGSRIKNVRFLPTQPETKLAYLLAAADICLVPLRKSVGDLSVPSKMYNIMAAGRPMIAAVPKNSEAADLVRRAKCGYVVESENPKALANIILYARKHYGLTTRFGLNGRKYVERNLNRSVKTGDYLNVLKTTLNRIRLQGT